MIPVLYRFPSWIPVLGDQAVTSFSALLLAAFIAGGTLFVRRLRSGDPRTPGGYAAAAPSGGWEVVIAAAVAGIAGAKLLHLAVHGALGLPTGGFGRGGLDWFGALFAGGAAALWQARRAGIPPAVAAAAAAPAAALGYAIGRIGSFLVGADYGLPTALAWGMAFRAGTPPTTPANLERFGASIPAGSVTGDFVRVHPTQLYEAGLSALILLVLLRRSKDEGDRMGWRLPGLFLILHGCARAMIELVRAKQDYLVRPVTVDLLLAVAAVALGFALRARTRPVHSATEPA